jgi:hypothetical protein
MISAITFRGNELSARLWHSAFAFARPALSLSSLCSRKLRPVVVKVFKMKKLLQILTLMLYGLATPSLAKDVLVLLPLNVDKSLSREIQLYGTALQQGLGDRYEVYFGPAVEDQLKLEYAKEDCTAQSCAQNLAIAFNGELIGDTSIQKLENSYVVQIQINNIITGQIEDSLIEICENCSKLSLIQFVKAAGSKAGRARNSSAARLVPVTPIAPVTPVAPKPTRKLTVNSRPRAAELYINDRFVGSTPVEIGPFEDGENIRLKLEKTGYETVSLRHIVGTNDRDIRSISLPERPPVETKSGSTKSRVRVPTGF